MINQKNTVSRVRLTANDGGAKNPPFPIDVQGRVFIRQCVDVLLAVCVLYGFRSEGYSLKRTYDHWIEAAGYVGDTMKFVKWKLAAFYTANKNTAANPMDLPLSPAMPFDNPKKLFCGLGGVWIRLMERIQPNVFESFLTTVLYSKKGMPRPQKPRLKLAEKEAFVKLTTPQTPERPPLLVEWGSVEEYNSMINLQLNRDVVCSEIVRTVRELFRGESYTLDDRIEPFFPSTSANYINTRSMGGCVGAIMDHPSLLSGLKGDEDLITVREVDAGGFGAAVICDDSKLRKKFHILYKRILQESLKELPVAKPVALAEALKTRVISKGPPILYTMLKPMQRKMWKILAKHPCFTLTGEPVSGEYVQSRMGVKLGETHKFLSVDYTDATNELYSWCSDACVEEICQAFGLTNLESDAFRRALTGHMIEYDGVVKEQTRGQLMGSIVSFPILCIINSAICRWALELGECRVYTLRDSKLAINGDDAILCCNERTRKYWEQIGTYCGLKPSVGKVYYSNQFLNINSTTYNFHTDGYEGYQIARNGKMINRIRHFELVQYVNMGLLLGLTRSGEKVEERQSLGAIARNLVDNSPHYLQERVLGQFIQKNAMGLKASKIPWFIPERFGGIGLPSVGRFRSADIYLRLARKIYEHPDVYKLNLVKPKAEWSVWQNSMKRFAFRDSVGSYGVIYDPALYLYKTGSWNTLWGLACVEQLFRAQGIKQLFTKSSETIERNRWRGVERTWLRAMHDDNIPLPHPFSQFPEEKDTNNVPSLYFV